MTTPSTRTLVVALLLAVSGATFLAGAVVFSDGARDLARVQQAWTDWMHPEVRIAAERQAVLRGVQKLARLETAVLQLEQQVRGQRGSDETWSWVGERLVFVARGEVSAGVDLSLVREEDVWHDADGLHIRLPRAELFRVDLDESASEVAVRDRGWFGVPDKDLESEVRREAVKLLRQEALDRDILALADRQARSAVEDLIGRTQEQAVHIEVR